MSTLALDGVLVVVDAQVSVLEVRESTLLVADGTNPIQIIEAAAPAAVELLTVADETVTLLTLAEQGPAGVSDAAYVHSQAVAASVWTAAHNLGKYPAVTVTDNLYAELLADVSFPTLNTVQVAFSSARSGFVFFS